MSRQLERFGSRGISPLRRRMEPVDLSRFFDGFFNPLISLVDQEPLAKSVRNFNPSVNVVEDESAITVTAEVPGMSEEDLDLSLDDGALVLRGEKKVDYDRTEGQVHFVGCSYGSFEQRIPIPCEVNEDAVEASSKHGKLTVRLPKKEESKERVKKISVKAE